VAKSRFEYDDQMRLRAFRGQFKRFMKAVHPRLKFNTQSLRLGTELLILGPPLVHKLAKAFTAGFRAGRVYAQRDSERNRHGLRS